MKKHLYLYLFIFASLIALIFYINGRKYQEKLEAQVTQLRKDVANADEEIKSLELSKVDNTADLMQFTLQNNSKAEDYFYDAGLSVDQVKKQVTDSLLSLNLVKGGNTLIPYTGEGRGYHINNIAFINHKWVLVNFFDGSRSGESLIEYNFDEQKKIDFYTLKTLLYLN